MAGLVQQSDKIVVRSSHDLSLFVRLPVTGLIDSQTWQTLNSTSKQPSRIPNPIVFDDLNMKFAYIPPGNIPSRDVHDIDFKKTITIKQRFYMQTTETTQGQWLAIMGKNPSHFVHCGSNCPVERVSWADVQSFITILSKREKNYLFRLPTSDEWEYACRSGSLKYYYTGDKEKDLAMAGWYVSNSNNVTHSVGAKMPNHFGLFVERSRLRGGKPQGRVYS